MGLQRPWVLCFLSSWNIAPLFHSSHTYLEFDGFAANLCSPDLPVLENHKYRSKKSSGLDAWILLLPWYNLLFSTVSPPTFLSIILPVEKWLKAAVKTRRCFSITLVSTEDDVRRASAKHPQLCSHAFWMTFLWLLLFRRIWMSRLREWSPNQTGPAAKRYACTWKRRKTGWEELQGVAGQLEKRCSCTRALPMPVLLSTEMHFHRVKQAYYPSGL